MFAAAAALRAAPWALMRWLRAAVAWRCASAALAAAMFFCCSARLRAAIAMSCCFFAASASSAALAAWRSASARYLCALLACSWALRSASSARLSASVAVAACIEVSAASAAASTALPMPTVTLAQSRPSVMPVSTSRCAALRARVFVSMDASAMRSAASDSRAALARSTSSSSLRPSWPWARPGLSSRKIWSALWAASTARFMANVTSSRCLTASMLARMISARALAAASERRAIWSSSVTALLRSSSAFWMAARMSWSRLFASW
ncbi:hypothetical protein BBK82_18220 [Lentzea guizhouensis]|uniref:Uncharacterized protein n=1 Tax=Lentzea guizhouensis TaxID=1586287 RepID=A0A1B2HJ11_9PSEU|nr:hypothetical protein BBK82_18220 [Lentzea guizhouensis]